MPIYTNPFRHVLLAAIFIAAPRAANAQQVWRVAGQETLDQATQISLSEFNERRLLDLCKAFIDANPSYKVLRYFVVTDAKDAVERLRGPGVTDIEFPDWLRRYKLESPTPPPTAELIKVRDQAVVRLRFPNGEITQRVIGAGNPLQVSFRGETVKVLGISLTPPGRVMLKPYPGGAHFFVQTSHPWTQMFVEDFEKLLRQKTELANVAISLEDGWWFAGEPTYPIYNRFMPYIDPPDFGEFKRHTRFYCDDLSGSCIQTGPAKQ